MPIPPDPTEGEGFDRLAWLLRLIRNYDPAPLRRIIRRAWSRVLMAICLAEARCHPASFRVRPLPASSAQQIGVGAGPNNGIIDPVAHLAQRLGLPQQPTGAIVHHPNYQPPVSRDGGQHGVSRTPGRGAARRRSDPRRTRGCHARVVPKRSAPVGRPDPPGTHRRQHPSGGPNGDPKLQHSVGSDHPNRPAWSAPGWSRAEERAGDLSDAVILAAALAGAGLGGTLLGCFGACLGLWIGLLVGGSYVERPHDERW